MLRRIDARPRREVEDLYGSQRRRCLTYERATEVERAAVAGRQIDDDALRELALERARSLLARPRLTRRQLQVMTGVWALYSLFTIGVAVSTRTFWAALWPFSLLVNVALFWSRVWGPRRTLARNADAPAANAIADT